MEFLHVGFKVNDIYRSTEIYRTLFGIEWEPIKEYQLESIAINGATRPSRTLVTHGKTSTGFEIEMIQGLDGEAADDIVLQGREGLSHMAFLVDDIDAAAAQARQHGLQAVSEYRSSYVDFIFFNGPGLGGALVQLVHFHGAR